MKLVNIFNRENYAERSRGMFWKNCNESSGSDETLSVTFVGVLKLPFNDIRVA